MKAWEYKSGEWVSIDYPLSTTTENVEEGLKQSGYTKAGYDIGNAHLSTFCATIYSHENPEQVNGYRWLITIDIGYSPVESVFIATFPDVLALLKDCSVIATAALLSMFNDELIGDLIDQKSKLLRTDRG